MRHTHTHTHTHGRTSLDETSLDSFHKIREVKDISLSVCVCFFNYLYHVPPCNILKPLCLTQITEKILKIHSMWNPARQYNMNVPIYFCIYVQIKEKSLYGEGANTQG